MNYQIKTPQGESLPADPSRGWNFRWTPQGIEVQRPLLDCGHPVWAVNVVTEVTDVRVAPHD